MWQTTMQYKAEREREIERERERKREREATQTEHNVLEIQLAIQTDTRPAK